MIPYNISYHKYFSVLHPRMRVIHLYTLKTVVKISLN